MNEHYYDKKEIEIMEIVANHLNETGIEQTPQHHRIDGVFLDDDETITRFIEVKSRNIMSSKYDTTKIEFGKWRELVDHSNYLPTILAIGWQDRIGWNYVAALTPSRFSLMNRRVIRRPSDWQIAVEIPVDQFNFITYKGS